MIIARCLFAGGGTCRWPGLCGCAWDGFGPERNSDLAMFSNSVLVVEDDPYLGPLLVRLLLGQGFRVYSATTAAEALQVWNETGQAVPVAIVDLTLPGGVSGEILARQLKADKPSLNLIVTS